MVPAPRLSGPRKLRVLQGSPEWLEARRTHITATDIPALLGVSPWRCEQDVADEKTSGNGIESTLRMRVGNALEDLIAAAYAEQTGRKVRRVRGLWESRTHPWAAASPDATGAGRLIELKWSGSRSTFAGALPDWIEAQVRWQLFVAEIDVADVAALTVGEDEVRVFTVVRDLTIEQNLIVAAQDFLRRLAAGGPFSQSLDSLKRKYPADDGSEIEADADTAAAVRALRDVQVRAKQLEEAEKALRAAIETRMGPATALVGDGFRVLWKAEKDRLEIDWQAVAKEVAAPEEVVSRHTSVKPGRRPLRVYWQGEGDAS